jgi:enoyl-CoA hydratase
MGLESDIHLRAACLKLLFTALRQQKVGVIMSDSSQADSITVTREGEVAVLTLRRPSSLDSAGKAQLTDTVARLNKTEPPRALILTASHPQSFLVNVAELADMSPMEARAFSAAGHRFAKILEDAPYPTIAAVEGPALGGGCELTLACDLIIAGEGASFGQIEALGGVMPGFGGTWRLARRVGYQRALEMMFTAAIVDASTALRYGLVLAVTPRGEALNQAKELASRIMKTSAASVNAIKRTARLAWNLPPAATDALEEANFPALFGQEESARMHAYLKQQSSAIGD